MIENFGVITREGNILKSSLSIKANMYNNTKDEVSLSFFNTKGNGIFWLNEGREITIFPNSGSIIGYPSPDLDFVIAIYYPLNNSEFSAPNNAVIYNSDGKLMMVLNPPLLISQFGKELEKKNKNLLKWFENVSWNLDSQLRTILTVQVGFGQDFFEDRVFNLRKGEFVECISSGKF